MSQANDVVENAFEAPKADLQSGSGAQDILEFKRFSAWGVFFLSIITLGIYYLYWLYSRGIQMNEFAQEAKVKMNALYAYIVLSVLANILGIFDENTELAIASGVLSLIGFVFYIIAVFSMRAALQEVINKSASEPVKLGGVLTFFFSAIYFQYKTNQAIDLLQPADQA
ncbi:hypothetical protein C2869_19080 [Saccharobesus litoralis]|uniref:DUF4234 domain-containing protein n=1 Tax=Saccharobesus litoralis TaxID=2172099 RepID=A0A2S0VVZ1_9ALTE|nr:DUF4234 domain-containing protein [Saccharobesus litoralis]AWB68378.1 hypothetical protein C2869_19080 [Saccharobesus litoralis]